MTAAARGQHPSARCQIQPPRLGTQRDEFLERGLNAAWHPLVGISHGWIATQGAATCASSAATKASGVRPPASAS